MEPRSFIVPPRRGGKVVAPATKGGKHFLARRAIVWFSPPKAAFILAPPRAPTSPAQRYYIPPEGGALNPPVRRSRSQAEPWQPRAERPGGWLNPHARKGVSTFGNTGKHRPADWYLSRDDSLPAYTARILHRMRESAKVGP